MEPLSIALFGLGRAGSIHLQNMIMNPAIRLTHLVDVDVDRARQVVGRFHLNVQVLPPEEACKVYEDPEVVGVVICTPTFTHEEFVRDALRHGKGVFCEKPIAEDVASGKKCYEEAKKAGKPLLCSFNRRFDPGLQKLRQQVQSGQLGPICSIHTTSRDHPLPSMEYLHISGGIYHDCGVHDLDLVCWILGQYPTSIYAEAHAHSDAIRDMDDVDTVSMVMKFPNNVVCSINLSRHSSYGYDQRVEVLGMKGMLRMENQNECGLELSSAQGVSMEPYEHSFPQRYRQSYVNALQHFVDVLKGEAECCISGEEVAIISEIASACEQSQRSASRITLDLNGPKVDH